MALSTHDAIETDRDLAIPHPQLVKEFRRYALGDHDIRLTSEQAAYAGALITHPTIDNACDLVLATAASRLQFTGYRVDSPAIQTWLDEFVIKNGLHNIQTDVHYRTLRDANHYLGLAWTPERQRRDPARVRSPGPIVRESPVSEATGEVVSASPGSSATRGSGGRVTVHHEPAWDGETGMFVGYDAYGAVAYAVKDFIQLRGDPPVETKRRVIYFPDRIERYIADGKGWKAHTLPGDDPALQGIIPWVKRDGRPLGVPVVHFAWGRFGSAPYGASDLAGILGLQDELNAALLDLAASAQLTAFPMIKVRGIDPTDKQLRVGPGRVLGSTNPNSDVGMMLPGDLSQLQAYHSHLLGVIARDTSTPEHLIGAGDWPSGIALQRADTPQISKVKRLATTVGPAWATLAHRATEIANAFGGGGLDEDAMISARFAPAEQLDPESQATFAKLNAEAYLTLSQIDDELLMVKTGLVEADEAAAIVAARDTRAAAAPAIAEF